MVDWGVARRIAVGVSGDPGLPQLPGDLAELCADAERRVVEYTGLRPATPLPRPEAIVATVSLVSVEPGVVLRALRDAGSRNPLFMIDEIDKMGADFRGDPSSAMLEV